MPDIMEILLTKSDVPLKSKRTEQYSNYIDISICGLLVLDEFDNDVHLNILEKVEEICDKIMIDKPHILGLSSNILKTNCSADDLKRDIYELENMSGCKVETSNEFAVTGCFDEKVIVCDEYR